MAALRLESGESNNISQAFGSHKFFLPHPPLPDRTRDGHSRYMRPNRQKSFLLSTRPLNFTGSGSFYEQSCRCLGDQLDTARALASQIADRSDIRYGMACVTTFGDFAEHAPHEL